MHTKTDESFPLLRSTTPTCIKHNFCKAITCIFKGYPGHPNDACPVNESLHVLSTQERAWIQTFPKDYIWIGSKTDVEQMIGNAVPVNLASFVAETVKLAVEEDSRD